MDPKNHLCAVHVSLDQLTSALDRLISEPKSPSPIPRYFGRGAIEQSFHLDQNRLNKMIKTLTSDVAKS
jgi:hypothetical protein